MQQLVDAARGRGAGRLVVWGGVAVCAFTAAFASWQYAPARSPLADTALATASIPTGLSAGTIGAAPVAPNARQVGGRAITTVPGASDVNLLQREVADLRQDLADLRRGLTRYDVANEQMARRIEAMEEQAAIVASRLAQVLDAARPAPPGTPAASPTSAIPTPPGAAVAATSAVTKSGMQKLEPALFDTRVGKVAPRPLTPEGDGKAADVKTVEAKTVDMKAGDAKPAEVETAEAKMGAAPVKEAKVAEPEAAKPVAKETVKEAAKPAEPVVATAPMPVAPAPAAPTPSTPPIAATVRPPPTPAEEAQRAQRALQAAQVQQLAQQMILQQPGGKGLQLPLPAQTQLAAAAAAAKEEAKPEAPGAKTDTTGSVGAGDTGVARTTFAVDLGGYKSLSALKKGWTATAAKHGGLTKSLTPLGQMKESGNAVEARLVAGPFANAADAAAFCAQVRSAGTACAPSVYVGQPLTP